MAYLNVFFNLVFLQYVLCANIKLPDEPCLVSDIECVSKSTQNFMDSTSGGIPEYDIRPIDPMIIPSYDFTLEGIDITLKLRNINVTGFKNQKISAFSLHKDTKEVNLKTKIDMVFNSDVNIVFHKFSKSFDGTMKAEASVEGGATYSFSIKTDEKGVEHYEVGPETLSCEVLEDPKLTYDPMLLVELLRDADAMQENMKLSNMSRQFREKLICDIVKMVYTTSVHNIRASARITPKSVYFKDV